MRTTLRTLLVSLTAATALVTMTAGPGTAATTAGVVSGRSCQGGDDCFRPAEVNQTAFQIGLRNKLNAILDELPNAGVARPGPKA
ncbi:MAG: hypothetical protein M3P23_00355 [Actinomycetota bacterium]|nr:hypothetical protein [Actinomycetota bacterium]